MNKTNIHVLPDPARGWVLCREGDRHELSHHAHQSAALAAARSLAVADGVELGVHDREGRVARRLRTL
ncbi:MAG: DUF2188 domain-containing protein [Planctomycetota bacterium]